MRIYDFHNLDTLQDIKDTELYANRCTALISCTFHTNFMLVFHWESESSKDTENLVHPMSEHTQQTTEKDIHSVKSDFFSGIKDSFSYRIKQQD